MITTRETRQPIQRMAQPALQDAAGAYMDAGAALTRAFLVVLGIIGLVAVLLSATVDRSIIHTVSDRVTDAASGGFTPEGPHR